MESNNTGERLRLIEKLESLRLDKAAIECRIGETEERIAALSRVEPTSENPDILETENPAELWSAGERIRASEALVTRRSSIEDKYRLFARLFAGRPDVHAIIWESGGGYSPDCANSFAKHICSKRKDVPGKPNCIVCEHKQFSPFSLEHFKAHINTSEDGWQTVLGAYPLNAEDNCRFIVADFDGKSKQNAKPKKGDTSDGTDKDAPMRARLTAMAFRAACAAAGVPVSMELSRSGKGYHIWLFFSDWVLGSKARRLFTALWTKTMEENAGLDFSVYDRFIPCQDTVSNMGLQGGIGNLVALPFQGRAGNQRTTVFLDAEMRFYPDQWEYLSGIELMSHAALDNALQRICPASALGELLIDESGEDTEGFKRPWEKRAPEAPLTKRMLMAQWLLYKPT